MLHVLCLLKMTKNMNSYKIVTPLPNAQLSANLALIRKIIMAINFLFEKVIDFNYYFDQIIALKIVPIVACATKHHGDREKTGVYHHADSLFDNGLRYLQMA